MPPALLRSLPAADVSAAIDLDAGIAVTGSVVDGAGDPVAGARVSMMVDGAPSTLATTSAAGAFSLRARAGGPVAVTVVPADGSGLPELDLPATTGTAVADGSTLAIAYSAPSGAPRSADPVVHLADGTTAPGARVTWMGRPVAGAGTVAIDGGAARGASGRIRVTVVAGAGGTAPAVLLPRLVYDVAVEPPPGAPAGNATLLRAGLDLGATAPPSVLNLTAPARVTATVVDPSGAPVVGALVIASPGGPLAGIGRAAASSRTGDGGSIALDLAGGGAYQIEVDGALAGQARTRAEVTAPAAGGTKDLGALGLPVTLRMTGRLGALGGVDLTSAHVELRCADCGASGGPAVVGQAVTDATGSFVLLVPDPGVAN